MTSYIIWYETDTHINMKTLKHGELTKFKKMCKENGYKIKSIEKFRNGKAVA